MATQEKQVWYVLKTFDTNLGLARAGSRMTFKKDVDTKHLEKFGFIEKVTKVKAVRTSEKNKAANHPAE